MFSKRDIQLILHCLIVQSISFSMSNLSMSRFLQKMLKHPWKAPNVNFSTLYPLSIGPRNLWHQKALAWLSWRLTIWTVGQQKTLISSFQGCFEGILRMFYESYKEDWRVFWESFEGVSRKFQGCFMKVFWKRKFQGCFKGVSWFSRVFPECFKEVWRKLLRVFKRKVSYCMALIAASIAEGGLVFI